MTKRPLPGPFLENNERGGGIKSAGRSEMKVVIGNILSEDFVGGIFFLDLKHSFIRSEREIVRDNKIRTV